MALNSLQLIRGVAGSRYPTSRPQAQADLALQAGAPAAAPTPGLAQQLGGQLAQLEASQKVQNVASRATQLGAAGQVGLQAQQAEAQARAKNLELGAREASNTQTLNLAGISQEAKKEIFDSRQEFARNQAGLDFTNTTQLADYVALTARGEQELKNFQTNLEVAHDRRQQILQAATNKLENQLKFESEKVNQMRDQMQTSRLSGAQQAQARQLTEQSLKQKVELENQLADLQKSLYEARAKAANDQMLGQGIGTVLGGAAGLAASGGTPAGGVAGAAVGGGVGGLINAGFR